MSSSSKHNPSDEDDILQADLNLLELQESGLKKLEELMSNLSALSTGCIIGMQAASNGLHSKVGQKSDKANEASQARARANDGEAKANPQSKGEAEHDKVNKTSQSRVLAHDDEANKTSHPGAAVKDDEPNKAVKYSKEEKQKKRKLSPSPLSADFKKPDPAQEHCGRV